MLNKIKCLLFGHVKANRDTTFTDIYIARPGGAFCRSLIYESNGRLYNCTRCGALQHKYGPFNWEIVDLIVTTLADLPNHTVAWVHPDYEFCRIYRSK